MNKEDGNFGRNDLGTPLNVLLGDVRLISSVFGCVVVGVVLSAALVTSTADALREQW